jgi:hypothetical protein
MKTLSAQLGGQEVAKVGLSSMRRATRAKKSPKEEQKINPLAILILPLFYSFLSRMECQKRPPSSGERKVGGR